MSDAKTLKIATKQTLIPLVYFAYNVDAFRNFKWLKMGCIRKKSHEHDDKLNFLLQSYVETYSNLNQTAKSIYEFFLNLKSWNLIRP